MRWPRSNVSATSRCRDIAHGGVLVTLGAEQLGRLLDQLGAQAPAFSLEWPAPFFRAGCVDDVGVLHIWKIDQESRVTVDSNAGNHQSINNQREFDTFVIEVDRFVLHCNSQLRSLDRCIAESGREPDPAGRWCRYISRPPAPVEASREALMSRSM